MPCPQDEVLRERGIQVDKFSVAKTTTKPPVQAFCLTHAHRDHMRELTTHFTRRRGSAARIYATEITARLAVMTVKGLSLDVFCCVEMYQPFQPAKGVTAWAFPSYHCDGSCMFLFEVDGLVRILYTGDFRWHDDMRRNALLTETRIDRLYYDDTFDEITTEYPSLAATLNDLRDTFAQLQSSGTARRIWFHVSVLGVEPLLRELADELGVRFSLSDTLHQTWRGQQLKYLLEHRLDTARRTTCVLGITKLDDVSDPHQPWIIPTCTYFLCGDQHKQVRPSHHHYVQFCTHSNHLENTRFKALVTACQVNPCKAPIRRLTCAEGANAAAAVDEKEEEEEEEDDE